MTIRRALVAQLIQSLDAAWLTKNLIIQIVDNNLNTVASMLEVEIGVRFGFHHPQFFMVFVKLGGVLGPVMGALAGLEFGDHIAHPWPRLLTASALQPDPHLRTDVATENWSVLDQSDLQPETASTKISGSARGLAAEALPPPANRKTMQTQANQRPPRRIKES
jgi:hypothetical protein